MSVRLISFDTETTGLDFSTGDRVIEIGCVEILGREKSGNEFQSYINPEGKDISKEDAWDHVAGLCVGQDISDRPVQFHATPPQFNLGKSFDTFGPIGPYLVSVSYTHLTLPTSDLV